MSIETDLRLPSYVVLASVMVPDGTDEETSEGEDDDGTFSQEDFKNPPFFIDWSKPGSTNKDDELAGTKEESKNTGLTSQLRLRGFSFDHRNNLEHAEKRLGVVIGYTRMRSISRSVNRGLYKEARRHNLLTPGDPIHFFWRSHWESEVTNEEATWNLVHKFYRQLKKKDPKAARLFQKEVEGVTKKTEKYLEKFFKKSSKKDVEIFIRKKKVPFFSARHLRLFNQMLRLKEVKEVADYIKLLKGERAIPHDKIQEKIRSHDHTKACEKELLGKIQKFSPLYRFTFKNVNNDELAGVFRIYDQLIRKGIRTNNLPSYLEDLNAEGERAELIDKNWY